MRPRPKFYPDENHRFLNQIQAYKEKLRFAAHVRAYCDVLKIFQFG